MQRSPCLNHCTSEPFVFFGRTAELALLDNALGGGEPSLVALVGPGGQGKTAIVQHWLQSFAEGKRSAAGVFLWSFYRGKDADLCLRELYAYAAGLETVGAVSASYCVDHLLPVLKRERWALIFDGVEVAQHDSGPWFGRFIHPELGRLLEELAMNTLPGVVVLTSRLPLPELERRRHARIIGLGGLDPASGRQLLRGVGVHGTDESLDRAVKLAGAHAKAVELFGTYLAHFHGGSAADLAVLPTIEPIAGASAEEQQVARVLAAFQSALPRETQDILALATAYREPPAEARLLDYLASPPVTQLLHETWTQTYQPFASRPSGWLQDQLNLLTRLRLLERVGGGRAAALRGAGAVVIDAHPLVRRTFEHVLGPAGRQQNAQARAGFLRGRPDRRRALTLDQARDEVELFHAFCDANLWNEADSAYVALENPKHRLLAPALERDVLMRFFPNGDHTQPPLWPGFGRYRSLAICFELLGQYEEALNCYRDLDAPLRGDALLALGRLEPLLNQTRVAPQWQSLWNAYRAHAFALAGAADEALTLVQRLVPVDVYEWVHVFESLLRLGQLERLDLRSVLYRPSAVGGQAWDDLARRRMQADYERVVSVPSVPDLGDRYRQLIEEYDRAGMPYERTLTRLSSAQWLRSVGRLSEAAEVTTVTAQLARQYQLAVLAADAHALTAELAEATGDSLAATAARSAETLLRERIGYRGPPRQ